MIRKTTDVVAAQLSNWLLLFLLSSTPSPASEKISTLFPALESEGCAELHRKAAKLKGQTKLATSSFSWVDGRLQVFSLKAVDALKTKNSALLRELFHPHLKMGKKMLGGLMASIDQRFGSPVDISLGKTYLLKTDNGKPGIHPCDNGNIRIFSQYGYDYQVAQFYSILGQKELGEFFMILVAREGEYKIAASHVQQNTHNGKNHKEWLDQLKAEAKEGHQLAAYAILDIIMGLTASNTAYQYTFYKDMKNLATASLPEKAITKLVDEAIPSEKVVKVSGRLTDNGVGVVIRMATMDQKSSHESKALCKSHWNSLKKSGLTKGLEAIRCSYLFPKEKLDRDGILGSRMYPL